MTCCRVNFTFTFTLLSNSSLGRGNWSDSISVHLIPGSKLHASKYRGCWAYTCAGLDTMMTQYPTPIDEWIHIITPVITQSLNRVVLHVLGSLKYIVYISRSTNSLKNESKSNLRSIWQLVVRSIMALGPFCSSKPAYIQGHDRYSIMRLGWPFITGLCVVISFGLCLWSAQIFK